MKNSCKCIKCGGDQLWVVDEVRQPIYESQYGTFTMPVTAQEIQQNRVEVGSFQIIICAACGYTEWYAYNLENLAKIPGARLVGPSRPGNDPYR